METYLSSTEVRNNFSEFIDSAVHDRPQVMIRNKRDIVFSFSREHLTEILERYQFTGTWTKDEEENWLLTLDNFDLIAIGKSKEEALDDMAHQLIDYAKEYYEDFSLYYNSPNRRAHFPYLLNVLTRETTVEVKSLIDAN